MSAAGRNLVPARADGLKPWVLKRYFYDGTEREIVYALTAADAQKNRARLSKIHSIRRATVEDITLPPAGGDPGTAGGVARSGDET